MQNALITGISQPERWYARLELKFTAQQKRTILSHRKHFGPLRVQKMLWPEKQGCVIASLYIHLRGLRVEII